MRKKDKTVSREIIFRDDAFEITSRRTRGGEGWLTIRTTGGAWSLSVRDDSELYGRIVTMCGDETFKDYLSTWLTMTMTCSMLTPDAELMKAFFEAYDAYNKRIIADAIATEQKNHERDKE